MVKDFGGAPKDAQALLGHADISTTQQIYQHANLDAQRAVLDRVAASVVGGVVTKRVTRVVLSKGQNTEIAAVTSGGPGGARTLDTLLKRWSTAPGVNTLTPVMRELDVWTQSLMLGRVVTQLVTQAAGDAAPVLTDRRVVDARNDQLQVRTFAEGLEAERLRTLCFPYSLLPPA